MATTKFVRQLFSDGFTAPSTGQSPSKIPRNLKSLR